MEKATITKLNKTFEEFAYEQEDVEYWLARELQELLGYADWRNFLNAIDKAKESCKTTGEAVSDHFVDVNKMIELGKGEQQRHIKQKMKKWRIPCGKNIRKTDFATLDIGL